MRERERKEGEQGYLGPTLTNCDSVDLGHVGFKRSLGDSDVQPRVADLCIKSTDT